MRSTKNTLKLQKETDLIADSELAKLSRNNVMAKEIIKSSINYGDLVGKLVEKSYRKYGQDFSLKVIALFTHLFEEVKEPSHNMLCCAIQVKHLEQKNLLDHMGFISDGIYGYSTEEYDAKQIDLLEHIKLLDRFMGMDQDALESDFMIYINRYRPVSIKQLVQQISLRNTNELQRCILIVDLLKKMQSNIKDLNSIVELLSELRMLTLRL
jgi:hypothetical protein